jgi:hypothetical protein
MHAKSDSSGPSLQNRTPLQTFMLARLTHLLDQRARFSDLLSPDDWRRKLIARALYSAYQDCLSAGLGTEAKKLFAEGREPQKS